MYAIISIPSYVGSIYNALSPCPFIVCIWTLVKSISLRRIYFAKCFSYNSYTNGKYICSINISYWTLFMNDVVNTTMCFYSKYINIIRILDVQQYFPGIQTIQSLWQYLHLRLCQLPVKRYQHLTTSFNAFLSLGILSIFSRFSPVIFMFLRQVV